MATYRQLIKADTSITDATGMCLQFARRVFDVPAWKPSAWEQWEAVETRHRTQKMPAKVAVPVWFSHYGTYGSPPTYKNWGHVVVHVPGRGFLSSPTSGFGQEWFPTIQAVERAFNSKFVGWSEDIGGVPVVEKIRTSKGRVVTMSSYTPKGGVKIPKGKQIRLPVTSKSRNAVGQNRKGVLTALVNLKGPVGAVADLQVCAVTYRGSKVTRVRALRTVQVQVTERGWAKAQVTAAFKTGKGERIQVAVNRSTAPLTATYIATDLY